MHDDATAVELGPVTVDVRSPAVERRAAPRLEIDLPTRALHALRRPANWLELVRFGLVGGTGFAVNLVVFAICVHALGVDYRISSAVAWLVALVNNFVLNRHWTFKARDGHAGFQAARFLVVSLAGFGFNLLLLMLFVDVAGLAKVPAQALAIAGATPLNFLGSKLWSFRA